MREAAAAQSVVAYYIALPDCLSSHCQGVTQALGS